MAWDGLVRQTGKYRSVRHMEYPKFQTGILVEWKAPIGSVATASVTSRFTRMKFKMARNG